MTPGSFRGVLGLRMGSKGTASKGSDFQAMLVAARALKGTGWGRGLMGPKTDACVQG